MSNKDVDDYKKANKTEKTESNENNISNNVDKYLQKAFLALEPDSGDKNGSVDISKIRKILEEFDFKKENPSIYSIIKEIEEQGDKTFNYSSFESQVKQKFTNKSHLNGCKRIYDLLREESSTKSDYLLLPHIKQIQKDLEKISKELTLNYVIKSEEISEMVKQMEDNNSNHITLEDFSKILVNYNINK